MDSNYFSENVKKQIYDKNPQKTVSIPTLIISILTTIVFILIVVSRWGDILGFFGVDVELKEEVSLDNFYVGDEVSMTGLIKSDGDILNYTHKIDSLGFGNVGLKSTKVNLNNYVDEVYIEGIVEKIYQGIPIISVSVIYSLDIDEDVDQDLLEDAENLEFKYFPNIGIYLDSDFFGEYSLINEGEGGILKVKAKITDKIVNVNYFKCNKSNNNQNCDRFNDMFSQASQQKFVDSYSITYYKQPDIQSWFFSNGSLFGYFINNIDDVVVKELVKYIQIINDKFVEKNVLNNIGNLCVKDNKKIETIISKSLYIKNNELYYLVEGNDSDKSKISCELKIDPSLKNMAQVVKIDLVLQDNENKNVTDENISGSINSNVSYDWSLDVDQFPLNLERSLQFTSRKGHTYVFPSSNIAYAGQNAQEDFGQLGVNCYSVMNVVQYSEKDFVDQKGNVKVYECSVKKSFDDSDKRLIYKSFGERHFVIEILDPAWVNFANNIQIIVD